MHIKESASVLLDIKGIPHSDVSYLKSQKQLALKMKSAPLAWPVSMINARIFALLTPAEIMLNAVL